MAIIFAHEVDNLQIYRRCVNEVIGRGNPETLKGSELGERRNLPVHTAIRPVSRPNGTVSVTESPLMNDARLGIHAPGIPDACMSCPTLFPDTVNVQSDLSRERMEANLPCNCSTMFSLHCCSHLYF